MQIEIKTTLNSNLILLIHKRPPRWESWRTTLNSNLILLILQVIYLQKVGL